MLNPEVGRKCGVATPFFTQAFTPYVQTLNTTVHWFSHSKSCWNFRGFLLCPAHWGSDEIYAYLLQNLRLHFWAKMAETNNMPAIPGAEWKWLPGLTAQSFLAIAFDCMALQSLVQKSNLCLGGCIYYDTELKTLSFTMIKSSLFICYWFSLFWATIRSPHLRIFVSNNEQEHNFF